MSQFSKDFSPAVRRSLSKKGIAITGASHLPSADGDYTRGERGYTLNDNGCQRIRTYKQVIELAS